MNLTIWTTVYRQWVWIGAPVMLVAAAALIALISGLAATVRRAQLFRVALAERQEVEFAEAGPVVLSMEAPRFSNRFARVEFELTGIGGDEIEGKRVWLRSRTSGVRIVKVALLSYEIPRPGRFVLKLRGLDGALAGDEEHAVVFTRPVAASTAGFIVGIALSAGILIASLVFFILRLRGNGSAG